MSQFLFLARLCRLIANTAMADPSSIIEGCFTKKAYNKWECFACGKIISTTGMNCKCAHITGTPLGHGIKSATTRTER